MVFDGKRQHVYVIRIGGRYAGPPTLSFERQTKMDRLPPRINSLRHQQQKFRRDTELAIAHMHVDLFVDGAEDSLPKTAPLPSVEWQRWSARRLQWLLTARQQSTSDGGDGQGQRDGNATATASTAMVGATEPL